MIMEYNVILWDFNKKEFVPFDIFPYLNECYQEAKERGDEYYTPYQSIKVELNDLMIVDDDEEYEEYNYGRKYHECQLEINEAISYIDGTLMPRAQEIHSQLTI